MRTFFGVRIYSETNRFDDATGWLELQGEPLGFDRLECETVLFLLRVRQVDGLDQNFVDGCAVGDVSENGHGGKLERELFRSHHCAFRRLWAVLGRERRRRDVVQGRCRRGTSVKLRAGVSVAQLLVPSPGRRLAVHQWQEVLVRPLEVAGANCQHDFISLLCVFADSGVRLWALESASLT